MSQSIPETVLDLATGNQLYDRTIDLAQGELQTLLEQMLSTAPEFDNWKLSAAEIKTLLGILDGKKRIIKSAFELQLEKQFSDFKTSTAAPRRKTLSNDWRSSGVSAPGASTEHEALDRISSNYDDCYQAFYTSLLKRLQHCTNRSNASAEENPLHVDCLCEAFKNTIDSLDLELSAKLALYRLYEHKVIDALAPIYRKIERQLIDNGVLPELKPARFSLRRAEGLSYAAAPKTIDLAREHEFLAVIQSFKDSSRSCSKQFSNMLPALKEKLAEQKLGGYESSIDQVSQLFEMIFGDDNLPSLIKVQISRLQIYVLLCALRVDGFLNYSTNPARRLFDTIIESEVDLVKRGKEHYSGLEFLKSEIDNLTSAPSFDADRFPALQKAYSLHLDNKQNSDVTEIKPVLSASDASKIARVVQTMVKDIAAPLKDSGKSLILLDKVWSPILQQIATTSGFKSLAWQKALVAVKTQVWSLTPKKSTQEHDKLLATLPHVLKSLQRGMQSLKLSGDLQNSLTKYLKLEHEEVVRQTTLNLEQSKVSTGTRLLKSLGLKGSGKKVDDQQQVINEVDDFSAMLSTGRFQVSEDTLVAPEPASKPVQALSPAQNIQVGDWVECKRNHAILMAKLAWKSDDSDQFIFVDREGKRVCEIDASAFQSELKAGTMKPAKANSASSRGNPLSVTHKLGS